MSPAARYPSACDFVEKRDDGIDLVGTVGRSRDVGKTVDKVVVETLEPVRVVANVVRGDLRTLGEEVKRVEGEKKQLIELFVDLDVEVDYLVFYLDLYPFLDLFLLFLFHLCHLPHLL